MVLLQMSQIGEPKVAQRIAKVAVIRIIEKFTLLFLCWR